MNAIRSSLFALFLSPSSGRFSPAPPVVIGAILLGGIWGYRLGKVAARHQWGIENLLGIRPKVIGQEKHAQALRDPGQAPVGLGTMVLQDYAWGAYCVFVLKKELLRVPLVGWGLAAMKMISIDRAAGKDALDQVVTQGRERLKQGFYVIIFPEGARRPGQTKRWPGGAYLGDPSAARSPVAHDAGECGRARPS